MRAIVLAATLLASLLTACSLLPCFERRDASGLLIVCRDEIPDMASAVRDTGAYAWELADAHPDAFGYPWADPATGAVELRIAGPEAERYIADWAAGRATRGSGEKTSQLPPPQAPLRRVATDRTVRQLRALMDEIVDRQKQLPDGDLIYQDGPDLRRNVIAVWLDRASGPLLNALAARYGTAAIVIHIEPGGGHGQPAVSPPR